MMIRLLVTAFFMLGTLEAITPPPEYVGHWKGRARIIVTFVQQRTLPVDVTVRPDGSVTGWIGDGRILTGEFRDHTWLEKLFGNPGYVIKVDLSGDLIAAEQIQRDGAFVIVNFTNGALTGGLNSFGTEGLPGAASYNRKHMHVSCAALRLEKQP